MTPLRKLERISYWVIDDPDGIAEFINTNIRREWEADARSEGRKSTQDPWLNELPRRGWRLDIVEENNIVLNPETLDYIDEPRGYNFQESLVKRRKELRRVVETYGAVIWPVIVRGEDMVLMDGYCRLSTLREMGVSKVFVYIGILNDKIVDRSQKTLR